jgi:hypothetical protein
LQPAVKALCTGAVSPRFSRKHTLFTCALLEVMQNSPDLIGGPQMPLDTIALAVGIIAFTYVGGHIISTFNSKP